MKDILNKIFKHHDSKPSTTVLREFIKAFPDAINAEWMKDEEEWEVVFHQGQVEKIVRLSDKGNVLEIRINMSIGEMPSLIRDAVSGRGEIMNAILIRRLDKVYWEIIYRDKELVRFLLNLDEDGIEIKHYAL